MKFKVSSKSDAVPEKLVYVLEDYAFSFFPISTRSIPSIAIDTLQLAIDNQGHVEVWGYCSYYSWQLADIQPPNFIEGALFVELEDIVPGVSERLAEEGEWQIFLNPHTGWLCIGESNTRFTEAIEFASNCVAVLLEDSLKAIWLRPERLPEIKKLRKNTLALSLPNFFKKGRALLDIYKILREYLRKITLAAWAISYDPEAASSAKRSC